MKYLKSINESSESNLNSLKSIIIDLKADLYNHCLDVLDIAKSSKFNYFTTSHLIELTIKVEYDKIDEDTFNSFKAKLNLLGNNTVFTVVSCECRNSNLINRPIRKDIKDIEYTDISVDGLVDSMIKNYGKGTK